MWHILSLIQRERKQNNEKTSFKERGSEKKIKVT